MKRILSIFLMLCIIIGLVPNISTAAEPLLAEEAVTIETSENSEPTVLTDEDYVSADAIWQSIREKEKQLEGKKATRRQTVEAVIALVEASEGYQLGSLERHDDCFTWKTTDGIACLYPYEEEDYDRGPSSGTPMIPPESNYEHISYADKGAPSTLDVYLIGPYYGVESNFTDHYKTVAKSVASAVGGTYTLYSYTGATIDTFAKAVSNGGLVLVDSHGTTYTLNGVSRSYVRLKSNTGLTDWDYDNNFAYYVDSSYIVTGEAISAHMTSDAKNSFVWFGTCSGMRYDTLCHPLIARGVEACMGYSRTVSFEYDRLWLSAFCNAIKSGKTAAQAFSSMQSSVGKWDWANEESNTYNLALSNDEAFPIMVSAQDDYPTNLQAVQTTYSTWKLSKCTHPSVSYVPKVTAGCVSTGNIAHYYCSNCNGHYSTSACTSRLSRSQYETAALGHSISGGSCSRCGYKSGMLWHFWDHYEESTYRWIPKNYKLSTLTRTDVSDRGYLYSTTDGGDHYAYMRLETDGVGYTVASGDIIEVRYRTVNLPSSKVDATGTVEFWYSTPSANTNFGNKLTASVTRKENQWQTVTFTPSSGVTIQRILFDFFEDDSGYAGSRFEVDYLYIGQASDAPSKRTEKSLFFDFKNDNAADRRYVSTVYSDINYDISSWAGNKNSIHTISYNEDNLSFNLVDGATTAYIQTSDGTASLSATPLQYAPNTNDVVQIRFKLENIQPASSSAAYLRLYYGKNDATGGIGSSDYTTICNLDSEALSGKYVTVIAPLEDSFTSASVINSIRPHFGNITNVSGTTGKITVDYIYVGAPDALPEGLSHDHEYNADGICTVCGRGHEHDFSDSYSATYRAATCTVPGAASKICADCGETVWVSVPKTAHSLSGNVCTVCGYVHGGVLMHFAANTPSAAYSWNSYEATTTVNTAQTGILTSKLNASVSDHYLTSVEDIGYTVQSGDIIEIKFKCDKARTTAQTFEVRYNTVAGQESFSSNTTTMSKSTDFAANAWTTVQFSPTAGQTVCRMLIEPFVNDDASFAGKTFEIDYIYIGPANGAPSKAVTTAPLYFDFTNDTLSQHRFLSSTYGYMQTIDSDVDHWVVNSNRATKTIADGALKMTVQSDGNPYAQIADASGSITYANAPLRYKLDGTDYAQVAVRFDNCALLSEASDTYVALYYLTDKTVEHENPSDQTTYNYGAKIIIDPSHLTDGQWHVYSIALDSALTKDETLISFRLVFGNVGMAKSGTSAVTVDYIAIGAKSELPMKDIYTVTFTDGAGNTLRKQLVSKGEYAYYGSSVTKAADDANHYVFNGWDKTSGVITADTALSASFKAEAHTKTDGVVTPATCTQDGYTTYTCSVCGTKTQADYVKGQHVPVSVNEKPATCTTEGYSGDTVCQTCGTVLIKGNTIATSGHDYGEGSVAIEPTCTEDGIARFTCKNCSNSYTETLPATGHVHTSITQTEPSCTQSGIMIVTCDDCHETVSSQVLAPLGHDYTDTVTAATCTSGGYTSHTCLLCGDLYVDSHVSALGHSYRDTITKPTCTAQGYTTHTCQNCGDSYTDSYTAKLTHSYVYTDNANGTHKVTCAYNCGYQKTEACTYVSRVCLCGAAEPCSHEKTAENIITEATCTASGSAQLICSDCGKELGTVVLEALGHSISEIPARDAACTQLGCLRHWRCGRCNTCFADDSGEYPLPESFFEIAATGHSAIYMQEKAATCTLDGYAQHYACANCSLYFFDAECQYEAPEYFIRIAATGHSHTYADNGSDHTVKCTNCAYLLNEAHSFSDGSCICGATESTEATFHSDLTMTMNVSVGAEMQVMYTILNARVKNYESFYVEVVKDVAGGQSVKTVFSPADGNTDEMFAPNGSLVGYRATYTGIFAMEMGDSFTATLYAVAQDGTIYYGPSVTSSIKAYLMEKLADSSSTAELKTLAVDMLSYGAAAQAHFSYNVENPVNADLTAAQKALGTQTIPSAADRSAVAGTGGKLTANVSLQSKVLLYVNCSYTKTASSKLEFVVKDARTGKILERFAPSIETAKICQGIYGNVGAGQMRELLTIELYDNGKLVSQTLYWNIESYVAQTRTDSASSAELINIVNALLIYGDSAAAYLTASGQ